MLSTIRRKWRDRCPKEYESLLSESLLKTFFILQEKGPLKFILKDEAGQTFQVILGSQHQCTCKRQKTNSQQLCEHIVWSLHRKLHVPSDSSLLFQTGLLDRELDQLFLLTLTSASSCSSRDSKPFSRPSDADSKSNQRTITENDLCPVCQELFMNSNQPVCSCQRCGNHVHVPCIKLVADHQLKALGQVKITCPLCRSEFQSLGDIEQAYEAFTSQRRLSSKISVTKKHFHPGIYCCSCSKPVRGRCFQCTQCNPLRHICEICFENGQHAEHAFKFRDSPTSSFWTLATRYVPKTVPDSLVRSLEVRELQESDYSLLLQLDEPTEKQGHERLAVVNSFPILKLLRLGLEPIQCFLCLDPFIAGDPIRKLPCHHARFHQPCIDRWLLQTSTKCPSCSSHVLLQLESGKFLPLSPCTTTELDPILNLCSKLTPPLRSKKTKVTLSTRSLPRKPLLPPIVPKHEAPFSLGLMVAGTSLRPHS